MMLHMDRIETTTTTTPTKASLTSNNNNNDDDENNNQNDDDHVGILFLHGLLGQGRNLKTFAKQLCLLRKEIMHNGWLMDLRGHGQSRLATGPSSSTTTTTPTTHTPPTKTRTRTTFSDCVADIEYTINHHHHNNNNNNTSNHRNGSTRTGPAIVVGHSWGGRMAVQYAHQSLHSAARTSGSSSSSTSSSLAPIKEVWLLDVVPGKANESVEQVVAIVDKLQKQQQQQYAAQGTLVPIPKKELVRRLVEEEGLDLPTSTWLASSYSGGGGGGVDFGFDLSVVQDILPEFGTQDLEGMILDLLQAGVHVHVVRAGKNRAWDENPMVWNRWKQLQQQQPYPGLLGLHILPKAGHWVHVDDLKGLVALFATNR